VIAQSCRSSSPPRVLLMAPLHHHFEMKAWSETKIIVRFWIIAAIMSGTASPIYYASSEPRDTDARGRRHRRPATLRDGRVAPAAGALAGLA